MREEDYIARISSSYARVFGGLISIVIVVASIYLSQSDNPPEVLSNYKQEIMPLSHYKTKTEEHSSPYEFFKPALSSLIENMNQKQIKNIWKAQEIINRAPQTTPLEPISNWEGNIWTIELGRLKVTFISSQMVRLEWSEHNQFVNASSLLFAQRYAFLSDSKNKPPFIRIFDSDGNGQIVNIQSECIHITYGSVVRPGWEYIYSPPLNHRTIHVIILDKDGDEISTWKPGDVHSASLGGIGKFAPNGSPFEPGLLSRDTWTFMDDSVSPIWDSNTLSSVPHQRNVTGLYTDWYLLAHGCDYRAALYDFVQVAGRSPLPPLHAFGLWWSLRGDYSDQDWEQSLHAFWENNIPVDNFLISNEWHIPAKQIDDTQIDVKEVRSLENHIGCTFMNSTLFSHPDSFLTWCHDQQVHVGLHLKLNSSIFHPAHSTTKLYPLCVGTDRIDYFRVDTEDWEESESSLWQSHCFFQGNEAIEPKRNDRSVILQPWRGLGSHRYPITYREDAHSSWKALRFQVYSGITAANVALGFVSYDIVGETSKYCKVELYTRWIQWGVLSPIFTLSDSKESAFERKIWGQWGHYPALHTELIRLRYTLIPFFYTEARRTFDTGVAMLYPLYYDFPHQDESYQFNEQGLIGKNVLISPITSSRERSNYLTNHQVFLPGDNVEWVEWSTLTGLSSGILSRCYAIDEIPIFIRAGSVIPMFLVDSSSRNMNSIRKGPLVVNVFPGTHMAAGSYSLYEDDGILSDYMKTYARTLIESIPMPDSPTTNRQWKIRVNPVQGEFNRMESTQSYIVRIVGVPPPSRIWRCEGNQDIEFVDMEISLEKYAYFEWALTRNSHNGKGISNYAWFYDYTHFAIEIQIPAVKRNQSLSLMMEWDSDVTANWDKILAVLHSGLLGAFHTINRVNVYALHKFTDIMKECIELLHNLKASHPMYWDRVAQRFHHDYLRVITLLGSLPPQNTPAATILVDTVIQHLKDKLH